MEIHGKRILDLNHTEPILNYFTNNHGKIKKGKDHSFPSIFFYSFPLLFHPHIEKA